MLGSHGGPGTAHFFVTGEYLTDFRISGGIMQSNGHMGRAGFNIFILSDNVIVRTHANRHRCSLTDCFPEAGRFETQQSSRQNIGRYSVFDQPAANNAEIIQRWIFGFVAIHFSYRVAMHTATIGNILFDPMPVKFILV